MNVKQLLYGVATFVPGFKKLRIRGTGGTISARYCYSVWMRHLVIAKENGLNTSPRIVAELGPGDSLGIGLAALIGGCDRYFAFDIVRFANNISEQVANRRLGSGFSRNDSPRLGY